MSTVETLQDQWNEYIAGVVKHWVRDSGRKQARSVRREKEINEAALRVFSRDGISRARIADIAAEAGMPISTIYEYYPSKEDLAYAVPINHQARFYLEFAERSADMDTAYERLSFYLWLSADFARRNPQWARLLYLEIWPSVLVEHADVLRDCIDDYMRILLYFIREGEKNGEWSAGPNHYESAAILSGSLNQIIITRLLYGKPHNLPKAASSLIERTMTILQVNSKKRRKKR